MDVAITFAWLCATGVRVAHGCPVVLGICPRFSLPWRGRDVGPRPFHDQIPIRQDAIARPNSWSGVVSFMEKHLRAIRRHHAARVKAAVRRWADAKIFRVRLFDFNATPPHQDWSTADKDHWVARTWQHPKVCSCSSCGNPRNSGWSKGKQRLTLAERRANCE